MYLDSVTDYVPLNFRATSVSFQTIINSVLAHSLRKKTIPLHFILFSNVLLNLVFPFLYHYRFSVFALRRTYGVTYKHKCPNGQADFLTRSGLSWRRDQVIFTPSQIATPTAFLF